jgi:hypothetical protein
MVKSIGPKTNKSSLFNRGITYKASKMVVWFNKYRIVIAIVVCGLLYIHIFLFIAPSFNDWSFFIEPELAGKFGDFIGGYVGSIFLLISVVLLYLTFTNQRETFQVQQFENRFYEMLKIVRENSNEIESKGENSRRVFVKIKEEILQVLRIIDDQDSKQEITENDRINLAYLVTFYGVTNSLKEQLKIEMQLNPSSKELMERIVKHLKERHDERKLENKVSSKTQRKYLEFDGHQSRLGHYYRHLFQTVSYVNDQCFLSYDVKYQYVRTLRAQLSTHEQAIFFFNSLSRMGRRWELGENDSNKKLVTKYNLIKNIPHGFIGNIDFRKYYPEVRYEGEERTEGRILLERKYK